MIYLHTKFHMPSSSGLIVITIKLKVKHRLHPLATFVLHFTKFAYPLKISYHSSFQDPISSGANIAPTSQVYVSAMLLLKT
jgi:hypothetical protein